MREEEKEEKETEETGGRNKQKKTKQREDREETERCRDVEEEVKLLLIVSGEQEENDTLTGQRAFIY